MLKTHKYTVTGVIDSNKSVIMVKWGQLGIIREAPDNPNLVSTTEGG